MRLVLDTNVVVSALLWQGPPTRLLQAARQQRVELFTSVPLLAGILGRRKFDRKIAASMLGVDQIVDRYTALATLVRPVATDRVAPDPELLLCLCTTFLAGADLRFPCQLGRDGASV